MTNRELKLIIFVIIVIVVAICVIIYNIFAKLRKTSDEINDLKRETENFAAGLARSADVRDMFAILDQSGVRYLYIEKLDTYIKPQGGELLQWAYNDDKVEITTKSGDKFSIPKTRTRMEIKDKKVQRLHPYIFEHILRRLDEPVEQANGETNPQRQEI